jgi:hypothetical protein
MINEIDEGFVESNRKILKDTLDRLEDQYQYEVFEGVLSCVQVKVYVPTGPLERSFLDPVFAEPIQFYGRSKMGWYGAVVRVDDA